MEKWLDAYGSWPPGNQLIFSVAVLVVGFFALFLFGLWTIQIGRYAVVAVRGWPDDPARKEPEPKKAKGLGPLCTLDFREEARRLAEEQAYQAEVQAEAQAELHEEVGQTSHPVGKKKALPECKGGEKKSENPAGPCTEEAPGGHLLVERGVSPPLLEEPSRGA